MLTPPASYAMHAHLIPSYDLDRVALPRTITHGKSLRTLLFESGGVLRVDGGLDGMQVIHA
jgi:hypothetical protein